MTAVALLAPGAYLFVYRQTFGFDPRIVLFGQAAILFTASSFGLLLLSACLLRARSGQPLRGWLLGSIAGAIVASLTFIFAGAFASNAAWGDTLNYSIALTSALYAGSLVDLLPVAADKRLTTLAMLLAAIATALLAVFVVVTIAVRSAARRIDRWLRVRTGYARVLGLLACFGGLAAVAGGVCVALVWTDPRLLRGEPITGFFNLFPGSKLHELDNVRLAAAIEDIASRGAYGKPAPVGRKHVVLIMVDSLRSDRMGLYGYHRPTTPFLSSLHERKQLHRVDIALSTCSESFCGIASVLSSRPFHQISSYNFKLHSLLRDQGYRNTFYLSGDHRGWNYLFDFYGTDVDAIHDFKSLERDPPNDDRIPLDAFANVPAAGAQPNFFYFFLMSSHFYGKRLPEYERFLPADTDAMRVMTFWGELAGAQRVDGTMRSQRVGRREVEAVPNRYDNGVLQADAYIARIFAILEAKGYLRDSIVVIVGDHGEGLGEHGHVGHTRYLFQEDIGVPLLIYDGEAASSESELPYLNSRFATQVDVAPTILDRLSLPIPSGWQGHSLMKPPKDRVTLHQTRRGQSTCFALVEQSGESVTKYMRCGDASAREFVFDLKADPQEHSNLVDTDDGRRDRYRLLLDGRLGLVVNRCTNSECLD